VHPWIIRDENLRFEENPVKEIMVEYLAGVNAVFTDYPHTTMVVFRDKTKLAIPMIY
jgi:hypothetical protein